MLDPINYTNVLVCWSWDFPHFSSLCFLSCKFPHCGVNKVHLLLYLLRIQQKLCLKVYSLSSVESACLWSGVCIGATHQTVYGEAVLSHLFFCSFAEPSCVWAALSCACRTAPSSGCNRTVKLQTRLQAQMVHPFHRIMFCLQLNSF